MALVTLFSDPSEKYAIEEDREGRLWLTIDLGAQEMHRLLTPGEARDFRDRPTKMEAKVRFMRHSPEIHVRKDEESEYRKQ